MYSRISVLSWGMVLLGGLSCQQGENAGLHQGHLMGQKTIEQVQREYTDVWMEIPGVVGTAIGMHRGKPCILVLTASDSPEIRDKVPSIVEGYPVVIQYTGEIRALEQE